MLAFYQVRKMPKMNAREGTVNNTRWISNHLFVMSTPEKMYLVVFGLCLVIWYVYTSVSEGQSAAIFRAKVKL